MFQVFVSSERATTDMLSVNSLGQVLELVGQVDFQKDDTFLIYYDDTCVLSYSPIFGASIIQGGSH